MNKTSFLSRFSAFAFTAAFLIVSPQALPESDSAQALPLAIEEIVVTARKRAESMQDAPVTMTAFSKEFLDLYNIDTLESLGEFTPGLLITDAGSQSGGQIAMRGMATGLGNTSFDQTVSVVFDGVAVNQAYIMKVSQLDMQQVEVLKGPQALFFGKNSPGGVISFRSVDPGDELEMSVRAGFETEAEEFVTEAVISGPISDTLAGRLVVYRSDMDGWVENTATDTALTEASPESTFPVREELFFRGTLLFEPNESLRMRTKISVNEEENTHMVNFQLVSCPGGFEPAGAPCEADDKGIFQRKITAFEQFDDLPSRDNMTEVDWLVAGHEIDYQINDDLQLSSVTGYMESELYSHGDAILGLGVGIGTAPHITNEHFTQELRLTSNYDGSFNFMLGAYYGDGELNSKQEVFLWGGLLGLPPVVAFPLSAPDPVYTVETESYSVFGELVWDISDQLVLSGGVRYTDESRTFGVNEGGVDLGDRVVNDRENDNLSPEISLAWRPTDDATYFISYREGFKSGGHNSVFRSGGYSSVPPGTIIDQSYEPETVEGVEAGFKLDLLDNRLRFNASAFYYEYTDMQLSAFDPIALVQRVLNAGESTIQGAEFDLLYLPESVEGLSLSLGLAYTDATFDRFVGQCYAGQTAAGGCNVSVPGNPAAQQDLAGRELLYAPDLMVTAGLTHSTRLSGDWGLRSALSLSYSDAYRYAATYGPTEAQDSYTKVNASLSLEYRDSWEFSLIGNNLTDEYSVGGGGNAAFMPPFHTGAVVSRGRQITLQARWSY